MRDYYESGNNWRTSDGRIIPIQILETDHLANIIDFVRWDAAKELGLTLTGPKQFDFSKLTISQRVRVHNLIKAKLPCAWRLRVVGRARGIWSFHRDAKEMLKLKPNLYLSDYESYCAAPARATPRAIRETRSTCGTTNRPTDRAKNWMPSDQDEDQSPLLQLASRIDVLERQCKAAFARISKLEKQGER